MQISDLTINSFFQISIHYQSLGLVKPDCVRIGLGLWLEVAFRSTHHVHNIMK